MSGSSPRVRYRQKMNKYSAIIKKITYEYIVIHFRQIDLINILVNQNLKHYITALKKLKALSLEAPTSGRVGNLLIKFQSKSLFFCQKSEQMRNSLKKWAICSFFITTLAIRLQSLIPSEWPEWIAHGRSFVLSNLSNLLTSLRRNEQIFCFFKKQ